MIQFGRGVKILGREVRCEREGQPNARRKLSAEEARSQQRDRNIAVLPRKGFDSLPRVDRSKVRAQLFQQFGKVVARLLQAPPQRPHSVIVAARRAPQAQIDAAGI